ncbi:MAG: hypothetical protein ABSG43_06140 [Solirubrobacteraceae bacterium]
MTASVDTHAHNGGEQSPLSTAAAGLCRQAAASGWRGPDPYDALWWRWPAPLVGGARRRQALTQVHARAPVDVRRLHRRPHPVIPKALALFGSAGLRLHALTGDAQAAQLAVAALELLAADRRAGPSAWGYPWDVQTRWSFNRAGSPSIVNCAFAVGALLEAERDTGRSDFGERARTAARWVLDALWLEPEGIFAYHPHSRAKIHNANLLGAWLTWAALGDDAEVCERVRRAVARTLDEQRPDGSWPYGEGGRNIGWADSFHTGYVLSCLDRLRDADPAIADAVARGASFYARFFGPAGESRLWAHRSYPEDGHAAGTGLTTLALLLRRGLADEHTLRRVSQRVLDASISGGHAVFRRYRWGLRTSVQYVRWCDAHVALGLVDAATAFAGSDDPAPRRPASQSISR